MKRNQQSCLHSLCLTAFLLFAAFSGLATQAAWAGNLFSGPINSPAARYAWALASGDFNGDGIPDLAVTNMNPRSLVRAEVKVLLGEGNGLFRTPVGYRAGNESYSVAVGDFNRDGKLDLVVANRSEPHHKGGNLSVFLGQGDGTFGREVKYKAGASPGLLAVADFNGDGIPDLVVTGSSKPGAVRVLLGKGDGTFGQATKVRSGQLSWLISAGDLNGDGKMDIIVSSGPKIVTTALLGNGDGTFQQSWAVHNQIAPYGIALGDFNGDGKLDLAETYPRVTRLTIRYGKGDGTFQDGPHYDVGSGPGPIAVADFDGDGILDLAIADFQRPGVSVLLGRKDGTFVPEGEYSLASGGSAINIIATDVNGDGKPDLVVTDYFNGVVSVFLNTGKK